MCWQCKNCTRPCGDRLPDGRTVEQTVWQAWLCVCVLVLPHLIRIFMHALHCHPGERVTACCLLSLPCLLPAASCHLRNQHNCAAHQAGGAAPAAFAALFSPDGSNQTYCTTTAATTKGAATGAGVKWRAASASGKWQRCAAFA